MYTAAMRAGLYRPKKRSVISRVDHTTATACHPRGKKKSHKQCHGGDWREIFRHRREAPKNAKASKARA